MQKNFTASSETSILWGHIHRVFPKNTLSIRKLNEKVNDFETSPDNAKYLFFCPVLLKFHGFLTQLIWFLFLNSLVWYLAVLLSVIKPDINCTIRRMNSIDRTVFSSKWVLKRGLNSRNPCRGNWSNSEIIQNPASSGIWNW